MSEINESAVLNSTEGTESFAEMLEESLKTLNTDEKVHGVVVGIAPNEVYVDVGRKQAGFIPANELSADPNAKPEDLVKIGDEIAMLDGEIVASSESWTEAVIDGIKALSAADDKEICVVFRGCDMSDEDEAELESAVSDALPDLEVNFIYGGQHIYHWLIGLI